MIAEILLGSVLALSAGGAGLLVKHGQREKLAREQERRRQLGRFRENRSSASCAGGGSRSSPSRSSSPVARSPERMPTRPPMRSTTSSVGRSSTMESSPRTNARNSTSWPVPWRSTPIEQVELSGRSRVRSTAGPWRKRWPTVSSPTRRRPASSALRLPGHRAAGRAWRSRGHSLATPTSRP